MDNQGAAAAVADQEDLTKKFCKKSAADSANQSSSDSREMSAKKVDYTALVGAADSASAQTAEAGETISSAAPAFLMASLPSQHQHQHQHQHQRLAELVPAGEAGAVIEGDDIELFAADDDDDSLAPSDAETERSVRVLRPVSTQQQFDDRHGGRLVRQPLLHRLRDRLKSAKTGCPPDRGRLCGALVQLLPFLGIMREYNLREWLLPDLISGLTVGIMHIPQGMAYAFLAELPPYLGLYTSFFPPLIYFFFGTSRQISMGTLAIVSLLIGSLVRKNLPAVAMQVTPAGDNVTAEAFIVNATSMATDQSWGSDPLIRSRVSLACATCLCVGLIQLLMGILRLGFLTRYLSDPLISGFTMGVAVHVFSSQIKYVLGISVPGRNGLASLPLHYYDLACNIGQTNFVTLGIAAVAVVILYVTKEFVNPRVRKKIKAPLPTELIIVTLGTVISYAFDLKKNYNVKIVGTIPTGIPPPEFPDLSVLQPSMAVEIITVAIIAFSVCVSLAKIFGKKYNYEVAPSQELIAYGICNTVGAFFHCWPAGSSLSRSAVQDSMGGKTQVAALVSSTLLLLVLLFVGKYFETVPNCCLSAIILVAIKGMLEQVKEAPILWRLSPYDFWTWIVTCLGVVLLSVDYGLIMGLAFSVFSIIVRTQSPTSSILGRITGTDLYKNVHAYDDIEEVAGLKIFRFEGSLYFACAENFRESLYRKTGVNPRRVVQQRRRLGEKYARVTATSDASAATVKRTFTRMSESEKAEAAKAVGLDWPRVPVQHVILDASTWGYIDYVGVRALSQAIQEYRDIGVAVYIANPKCGIRACLERSDFYEKNRYDIIYVSVHDAVLAAQFDQRAALRKSEQQLLSASSAAIKVSSPTDGETSAAAQLRKRAEANGAEQDDSAKAVTKV
ncbi:hypothetical protein BOX15_Mlig000646g5 [Macrostomum lignano]|uniref:STAS domain-containing protein n=1 Tax=Macrostomum lignano TaxID=282301 RepID=A0A267FZD4_9PLAT|nr:hypothetical protein BOX15_Mlig000646g5 [Macrostomum lignano]